MQITSPIISLVVGSEEAALHASRFIWFLFQESFLWLAEQLTYIYRMMDQIYGEVWVSCDCDQAAHSSCQFMQVFILFRFSMLFLVCAMLMAVNFCFQVEVDFMCSTYFK